MFMSLIAVEAEQNDFMRQSAQEQYDPVGHDIGVCTAVGVVVGGTVVPGFAVQLSPSPVYPTLQLQL